MRGVVEEEEGGNDAVPAVVVVVLVAAAGEDDGGIENEKDAEATSEAMRSGRASSGAERSSAVCAQKSEGVRPWAQFSVSSAAPWM